MNDVQQIIEKKGERSCQINFARQDEMLFAQFLLDKDILTDEQLAAFSNTFSEGYRDFIIWEHENELLNN